MLTLTTPPAGEPLLLPDVKAILRVEHEADDALLARIITTARTFVERRLDLAILRQSWTLTLPGCPGAPVPLRPGKVAGIVSGTVTYKGEPARPLAEEEYALIRSVPACVRFDLPPGEVQEITLIFEAGWAAAADVPADLLHALGLLVAHYYEERELFGQGRYVPVPHTLQSHLAAFREVRL